MYAYTYDGTFGGLLSVVFDCYKSHRQPDSITEKSRFSLPLFASEIFIPTDEAQAQRVWTALKQKSEHSAERIYRLSLADELEIPLLLYNYIRLVFDSSTCIDDQLANPVVLAIDKWFRAITREAHRALMFIRFQKLNDKTWFAAYEPKYNILPLVTDHFKDRFADQPWIIYDTKRHYGFHYDLRGVQEVAFTLDAGVNASQLPAHLLDSEEQLFQTLWKDYYHATTITERHNMKVHIQFLPKRFWKHLPEKR